MTDNVIHIIVLVAEILLGVAIMIPLVKKLVEVSKQNIEQKNWYYFLDLVLKDMEYAQDAYQDGMVRRNMVLKLIEANADAANYPLTESEKNQLVSMIDSLVEMANIVGIRQIKKEELESQIAIDEDGKEITVGV
ncbi:MAG: hypothetical protein IJA72_01150 [Clostridia bacterium]|nr:hypothetical protein [Clostridia bacterium]